MDKRKTHYALCDRATESHNTEYWSDTACGLKETEAPLSENKDEVTCKKCLARIGKMKPNHVPYF